MFTRRQLNLDQHWMTMMFAVIAIVFLAAFTVILCAMWVVSTGQASRIVRLAYWNLIFVAFFLSGWSTYLYHYIATENIRVYGWPVPSVILERDGPDAPWLDFIGPTVILGWPMNFTLFAILPSAAVIGFVWWRNRTSAASTTEPSLPPMK